MAVFLNKPSDFTAKRSESQETLKLLPPSVFEKPKSLSGSWTDMKKATEEIQALKQENQKLKEKFEGSLSDSAASEDGRKHQSSIGPDITNPEDERRYADELISRQAEEVSKLRLQVQQLEHSQQAMRDDYDHRLAEAERERDETVSALTDSLHRRDQEHDQQVNHLKRQHEGEVSDLKTRLEHISNDLDRSKGGLTSQLSEVTEEVYTLRQQARDKEESFRKDLEGKNAEIHSQAQQIQQLKTYITESEQQHRPQQVWMQQCETLTNKLKVSEAEKETLNSSIQLLEVRLSSLKEILLTQETELSKGKEHTMDKNKLNELVLTRWRQKVYAMLVQQKSAEITCRKDLQNWKEKTDMLEDELSSAHNTINILQHTLAEKEADHQLVENHSKRVQEELNQAQQVALALDAERHKDSNTVQQLANSVHKFEETFDQQSSVLHQALGQLKSLGQRVSFASSRMDVLKSQLTRKEALQQLHAKQPDTALDDPETEDSWKVEEDHLTQELSRVSAERDMLAAQLHQDSQTWTDNIASLRTQYNAEVSSLKKTVEDLELSNQEKSRTIDQLRQDAEVNQTELTDNKECVERLSAELARHDHTMQQALEDQRKQLEEELTEQLAQMERQVNDARREHTKAVVILRQQERQWSRERERSEELKSTTEAHYMQQVQHLHQELQTVEAEKNLCMATLRQEGLLGKVRADRREPMKLELQEEVVMGAVLHESQTTTTEVTETDSTPAAQDSSEPVSAVLEDLKSLVPALLDESADSSDENED